MSNNIDTLTGRKVIRTEQESIKEYCLDKPINSHNKLSKSCVASNTKNYNFELWSEREKTFPGDDNFLIFF